MIVGGGKFRNGNSNEITCRGGFGMIDRGRSMKGSVVFIHMIGKRVAENEGKTALLTLVTLARFVNHQMRKVFHGRPP